MADYGMNVTTGDDMTRIQVSCEHQSGLIYIVPAERSWVCSSGRLSAHAMAGFFRELTALQQPEVRRLMQEWGVYYRALPIAAAEGDAAAQEPSTQ